jgi:predicted transcriptional regulator
MNTLTVRIESSDAFNKRFADVFATGKAAKSSGHSFPTYEAMHRTLSPKRIEIVKAMAGQGVLGYREVARRVGRDFKGVHTDISALIKAGLINRESEGVVFPYGKIRFDFKIEVEAA